jgi:hypothetical protein
VLFSQYFGVDRNEDEIWFDPILDSDTDLFIDPFLIFKQPVPPFESAHEGIVQFFNQAFQLAATTGGRRTGPRWERLLRVLNFPEPKELCLGYTEFGTSGSGSGQGFSRVIAAGILESIARGIVDVTHFEEIGLLHEGIAHDRISDITANILKPQLVTYTTEVAARHGLKTHRLPLRNAVFDADGVRWVDAYVDLPINPFSTRGVLLVPRVFLRQLPTINKDDFWDYLWTNESERMRAEFGDEVKSNVPKRHVVRIARENQFLVRRYIQWVEGRPEPTAYDLDDDPRGVYRWDTVTALYVESHPLAFFKPTNHGQFIQVVEDMVHQFRHYVEQDRGWELLWNDDDTPRRERAAQNLFRGIVKHHCRARNIVFSREVDTGRGPVDFEFATGYSERILLEVKLVGNTRFWHGLTDQLPTYLEASELSDGYFLAVAYVEKDLEKVSEVQQIVRDLSERTGKRLRCVVVDASPKLPASKI